MEKNYVRLPLEHAYNVRDLGGYPCNNNQSTKWHNLLRADDLSRLDENEIQFLIDYGVKVVIDLRSSSECERSRNPFLNHPDVQHVNIPLMGNVIETPSPELLKEMSVSLKETYIDMIENAQEKIKRIMAIIIESKGGVLFHCSAGKDRTGVVAMLLLGVVGCVESDIISNYEVSYTNLCQNEELKKAFEQYQFPKELLMSKAEWMKDVLVHISEKYASVTHYLRVIGLSENEIVELQQIISE